MATKRKRPEDKLKVGAKVTKPYLPEYCNLLIEHMKEGFSFESFGATAHCSRQQLYIWEEAHPEFFDAKKEGETLSLKFYETLAKMQATGQLRRLKSEKALIVDGKVQFDPKGNVIMEKEWEQTTGSPATLIFMLKNMHGWRDKKDINVGGQEGAPPIKLGISGLPKEQLQKRYDELMAKALKK